MTNVMPYIAMPLITQTGRNEEMSANLTTKEEFSISTIETGIDWITLTCRKDDPHLRQFYRTAHQAMAVQKSVTKEQPRTYSNHGYRGWSMTGLAWGMREDGEIIVASGAMANVYWRLFHKFSSNVSRFDLQTTVMLENADPDVVGRYWHKLRDERRPRYTIIRNNQGGSTFYVGSRHSDQFGRVYDKGVQGGFSELWPGKMWRYEVEYKSERARIMANNVFTEACRRQPIKTIILATVYDWFETRNVKPVFTRCPNDNPIIVSLTAKDESLERTLRWLQTQVKPAVKRCLKWHQKEVLVALGLEHLFYSE